MRHHYPNPFMMAHAEASSSGVGGTFGAVSLYNDASAPVILAVWNLYTPPANASAQAALFIASGKIGASPVQGLPIVSNNPAQPGQVTFGNVAAVPASGQYSVGFPGVLPPWFFPLAVLTQGYSLTAYASAINTIIALGFIWEAIHPDEFRARYTLAEVGKVLPGTP